ncbi:16S rRNA (cytidine(1402)-2'-O)-methyltransferase [Gordonia rubripertincta]|uniref:Ribosomal RNA small subunit methyltransferase I n=2 Tax=Gordonia rubripertincta TaxID=36822 RepID=A0AAW6R6J7_GORRU|nr:16S rRNA (cytidine(1402)-2'-O)-methyltransferase [Gordonia rubripertincta]MDG6780392.1 16S rRNA (cytidine(1402)-2'-O)-methyltransferase [Gordonia rubripertincta]NKY64221.1 16S rRNA (cytidine(1402)-2'-O)-methyltransferase [Gordonia rubripertincta]GAB87726.1 putative rRNA small subunit methyltransferase I [Gordonia rubripertincta NBRC 101908]
MNAAEPDTHPTDDAAPELSSPDTGTTGRLVLAATPMGQVGDASPRLREALQTADIVAAEDTRRTRALAAALGVEIGGRVVSYYDQVEAARTPGLVEAIAGGETVLLVTDAGMPSVSDPGYRIVVACAEAGLPVTALPGPSAVTTALAVSALPSERFCFEGFAPRKPGARADWLRELVAQPRTAVFFESPHRLADTLAAAAEILGPDRRAAVCREMTKTYEEVRRGGLAELADWAAGGVKGEITVVVAGAVAAEPDIEELADRAEELVVGGMRLKDACAEVTQGSGASRRDVYQSVLDRRRADPS